MCSILYCLNDAGDMCYGLESKELSILFKFLKK